MLRRAHISSPFARIIGHVHGLILLTDGPNELPDVKGAGLKPAPTKFRGLPEIVRAFKTFSARAINQRQASSGGSVWQRNYYEHVVRDENDLNRIRKYIADNPACWAEDSNNPEILDRRGGF
jgi:REP element-mobilizing transposase RayT